jgi:hypothetical protein
MPSFKEITNTHMKWKHLCKNEQGQHTQITTFSEPENPNPCWKPEKIYPATTAPMTNMRSVYEQNNTGDKAWN